MHRIIYLLAHWGLLLQERFAARKSLFLFKSNPKFSNDTCCMGLPKWGALFNPFLYDLTPVEKGGKNKNGRVFF